MAEIVDVINKFTYEVEDKELQQASQQIQNQINGLGVLAQRQLQLQQAFDRTSANEIQKRTRIAGLIQQTKQRIDETTQSIGKQVRENEKLQNAITREIGLINTLDARLKVLREDRAKAFDVKDIQRYNREIEATQKRISKLTSTNSGGVLGRIGGSILQGVGIGTGIGLVTQGVSAISRFIGDSIALASELEGVQAAFDRLNEPDLLANLRESTKGTVSDLELMKQAISFSNFGLPLEQLGTALEFARRRAKDTGQEVDYLVNSIVTGIGRQSPLILDNLGINAKRVSDRFKETGDFAKAAFGIIREEIEKSGADLDTFSEKQARLNARIANFSAEAGNFFTNIAGGFLEEWDKIIDAFQKDLTDIGFIQDEAENESVNSLDEYLKEYQKVDSVGRRAIENQVSNSYNELIRKQQELFRIGEIDLGNALNNQLNQYKDFYSQLRALQQTESQKTVDFNNFTRQDLLGLTREELQELKQKGEDSLNPLAAGDTEGIRKVNNRIALIDEALGRFRRSVKSTKATVTESKITTRDLIAQTPEEWAREIDRINEILSKIGTPFSRIPNTQSGIVEQPENLTGQTSDEIITQRNEIRRREKAQEEADDKAQAARELRVQQEKDAFNTIANAAIQSYNTILQAQINSADAEIAIRQSRVNAAIELAKDGNDEILKIEQKRLEESIRERERFAQRQAAINAALTVSQSILAIATAAGESGAGALVIVPAVIAAIAAGFSAVTALSQETSVGFKDGGVDIQGAGDGKSDSIPARISKGESVITAEATAKNKEILKAMNNGAVFSLPNTNTINNTSHSTTLDMGGVIKELRSVKKAVANNAFKQDIFFNEHGVGVMTEKAIAKDRRKWS